MGGPCRAAPGLHLSILQAVQGRTYLRPDTVSAVFDLTAAAAGGWQERMSRHNGIREGRVTGDPRSSPSRAATGARLNFSCEHGLPRGQEATSSPRRVVERGVNSRGTKHAGCGHEAWRRCTSGPSLGRPRWLLSTTLAPCCWSSATVGIEARMRVSSAIARGPSFVIGVLRSARTKTLFPASSLGERSATLRAGRSAEGVDEKRRHGICGVE